MREVFRKMTKYSSGISVAAECIFLTGVSVIAEV